MIQIMKNKGWLVVAAALTIGLSACSSDEIASGEQTQQAGAAQTISVTVGAGFDADASTRSDVIYDETAKTRTLTFTKGDRLFVEAYLFDKQTDADNAELTYYDFKIAGLLTMVENSLSSDGKTAQFSGELTLLTSKKVVDGESTYYKYEKSTTILIDFEGKDPLSEAKESSAVLIHEDGVDGEDFTLTDSYADFTSPYVKSAADVKTLMTTKMYVSADEYDADNKSFKLKTYDNIIFNCAIDGLAASTSYKMVYCYKTFWSDYDSTTDFQNSIKTDASGKAVFAFAAYNSGWVKTHAIKFIPLNASGAVDENGEVMIADIIEVEQNGLKEDMVYNISRTATSESGEEGGNTVDLSTLTANYTAKDGDVLTGTLNSSYHVTIESGASVTLKNATIEYGAYDAAAITCAGNATIILADGSTNSVTVPGGTGGGSSGSQYPGILVGGTGTKLTIKGGTSGTGKLTAVGGYISAGIGCMHMNGAESGYAGGEIQIDGGEIYAYSGNKSALGDGAEAGIGSVMGGQSGDLCEGITINGGKVTAKGGTGIGASGPNSSCSFVKITGGEVNATGFYYAISAESITISGGDVEANGGEGCSGITGNSITIEGGTVTARGGSQGEGILFQGEEGTIAISGASTKVYAYGGDGVDGVDGVDGNPIGTMGSHGIMGNVSVTNATLEAYGGTGGDGYASNDGHGGNGGYGIDGDVSNTGGTVKVVGGNGGNGGNATAHYGLGSAAVSGEVTGSITATAGSNGEVGTAPAPEE